MTITLLDEKIEENIREIGRHTGEEPSAVISRVIEAEARRLRAEAERQQERTKLTSEERLARMRAFRTQLPKLTDEERKAVWDEADRMFDYLYEDKRPE